MDPICFLNMCKFRTIVCLEYLGLVAKVSDGPFQKVYRWVTALFHIRVYKTFSGGFINDGILVELLRHRAGITGCWNIFDIHLPFGSKSVWGVIRLWIPFAFGWRGRTGITQLPVNAIEWSQMSGITFDRAELSVQFTDRYFRIAPVIIINPFRFFGCVWVRMFWVWPVWFIKQRLFGAIKFFVPTEKWRFGN